jgi:hypothetical protein
MTGKSVRGKAATAEGGTEPLPGRVFACAYPSKAIM